MLSGHLSSVGGNGLQVGIESVYGYGRLAPVLRLSVLLQSAQGRTAELLHVVASLWWRDEYLGRGDVFSGHVDASGYQTLIEIPTARPLLDAITAGLGTGAGVELQVKWSGRIRFGLEEHATQRMAHEPGPGEWKESPIHNATATPVQISRSAWFEHVLSPTRAEDYVYLEVTIPRGPAAAAWRNTLAHLTSAEKAFAIGDDAAVFVHLRAAFDALPGAKKHIFDTLSEPKRSAVDALTREIGEFLHLGRHVAAKGTDPGTFPVDHIDAEYVIAQMKVFLSYASRVLSWPSGSGQ